MSYFKKILWLLLVFLTCSTTAYALNVDFYPHADQSNVNESVDISLLVTNASSTPINDTLVTITTSLGSLTPSSNYTNSSGVAVFSLNSTIAGNASINATVNGGYNLTNVTFLPLEITTLLANPDSSVATAGNISNISFYPLDVFGNVNSSEDVNLTILVNDTFANYVNSTTLSVPVGSIAVLEVNQSGLTTSYIAGPSDSAVLRINSTVAGDIYVNSSVVSISNETSLQIVPASPELMHIYSNDDYTVNTSAAFYLYVYDKYSNPIDGASISFSVTSPEDTAQNSPIIYNSASVTFSSGLTNASGYFYNNFRLDKRAGDNTITITVADSTLDHNLTFTGIADEIDQFSLVQTPESVVANSMDSYTLSGCPVDKFKNPIIPLTSSIKEMVRFETDSTNLLVPLNGEGKANINVGPTSYVESVSISATYRDESGDTSFINSTVLNFTADELDSMNIYAVPDTVLDHTISGNHNSTLTVFALDQWGHQLPDIVVTLNNTNTTVGTLTSDESASTDLINLTTNSNGRVFATFTGNISGNSSIVASSSHINTSINVTVEDEPFMSITLNVTPPDIESGDLVNVTTVISIEGDLPVTRPAASAMLVLDRSGSMDPDYYAGTPLDVVLVIDRSGSMGYRHGNGMYPAKEAAKKFASNLVSNSQIGVVSFGSSSSVDLDLTLLNSSANLLLVNKSVDKLAAVAGTALGDGMADGNNMLINDGRSGSRKVMILLTDGVPTEGTNDSDGTNAIALANSNDITIYTIGLGSEIDETLLRSIASETGGTYYSAPDNSDLASIYNSIAQEISDYDIRDIEYSLEGFTPYSYTFSDDILIGDTYTLSFEGQDFDHVFNASLNYGGTSAGECLFKINGEKIDLLPSATNYSNSGNWTSYEYDITNYAHSGENSFSFYDYYEYLGYRAYDVYYEYYGGYGNPDIGDNKVRDITVSVNGDSIASYSGEVLLDGDGYLLTFDSPLSSDYYENTFTINESINDLKVELQWEHDYANLNLQLVNPSGKIYGIGYNTTGYYPGSDGISEYIWINTLSGTYPDDDYDTVEEGTWTVRVTGMGANGTGTWDEDFTVSTYIDKKSAAQLSSYAFISGLNESDGDSAGLALYSYEDVVSADSQTSYVSGNGTWVGYFSPETNGEYNFNVTWSDSSSITVNLYEGIDLLSSSSGTGQSTVSSMLTAEETYYIEVEKEGSYLTETLFTIDVSGAELDSLITAYSESGESKPQYRTWDADSSAWNSEQSGKKATGTPYNVVIEASPVTSELLMLTSDSQGFVDSQVWGSTWSSAETLNTGGLNSPKKRGFDIKYEQLSGDAVIVYVDSDVDTSVPQYRVWDGSSWSTASLVNMTGSDPVEWVKLAADPNSDNICLVTKDDSGTVRACEWNGSAWGSSNDITSDSDGYYDTRSFDVVYDNMGRATIIAANWDISWESRRYHSVYTCEVDVQSYVLEGNTPTPTAIHSYKPYERVWSTNTYDCWITAVADPNSDDIIVALEDDYDVYAYFWTGSSWSVEDVDWWHSLDSDVSSVDVGFSSSSGDGIIVWGDGTIYPKYRTTSDGITWSSESSASYIGATVKGVQLTSDPYSDKMFLLTSDSNNDLNYQIWDGSSWGTASELEDSLGGYECFDMTYYMDSDAGGTPVLWNEWTADVVSTLSNDSLSHLESAVDGMTADGLTAIDEGMFAANSELSSVEGNSTIILMTDGLDNAGYHSLLEEAQKAADNSTTIYTVGFGNNESEVDPVLEEIADMTGGEYYFAPNSSVLEAIFEGIAMQITNFSAAGPELEIHVPYNYATGYSTVTAVYVNGSSNSTTGNETAFTTPTSPATGNAEPDINLSTNEYVFSWDLPTMTSGDKWGIWYQMKVSGAGYAPLILPTSTITYMDFATGNVTLPVPETVGTTIGGSFAEASVPSLGSFDIDADESMILVDDTTDIEFTVKYSTNDTATAFVWLYTDVGYFGNYENPINLTYSNESTIDFHSAVAGNAHIQAYAYSLNNVSDVLTATETIAVRPSGRITIS